MSGAGTDGDGAGASAQELLERAVRGDQEAWRLLHARYRALMLASIRDRVPARLRGRIDPEEVVQSAFLTLSRAGGKLEPRGEAAFRAWLVKVVRNKLADRLRAAGRDGAAGAREERIDTALLLAHPDAGPLLEDLAIEAEMRQRLRARIEELSEPDRALVRARYEDGEAWERIAVRTGLSEATARRRATEAIATILREVLG